MKVRRDLKKLSRPLGLETQVGKKEPVGATAQSWAINCVCEYMYLHTHVVELM